MQCCCRNSGISKTRPADDNINVTLWLQECTRFTYCHPCNATHSEFSTILTTLVWPRAGWYKKSDQDWSLQLALAWTRNTKTRSADTCFWEKSLPRIRIHFAPWPRILYGNFLLHTQMPKLHATTWRPRNFYESLCFLEAFSHAHWQNSTRPELTKRLMLVRRFDWQPFHPKHSPE